MREEIEALLESARNACLQGRYAEAYATYEKVLQSTPNEPTVVGDYAKAKYREFRDLEQATQLFERANELDPRNVDILLWLGDLYGMGYGQGYSASARIYRRAIGFDPDKADAYIGLGMLHRAPGTVLTLAEAISAFRKASQVEPDRGDAHLNLGVALIEAKDIVSARQELQTARQLLAHAGNQRQVKSIDALLVRLNQGQPIQSAGYSLQSPRYHWPKTN